MQKVITADRETVAVAARLIRDLDTSAPDVDVDRLRAELGDGFVAVELDGDGNPRVKEGDRVEAVVIQADESSGSLLLGSKDGGRVHDSAEEIGRASCRERV